MSAWGLDHPEPLLPAGVAAQDDSSISGHFRVYLTEETVEARRSQEKTRLFSSKRWSLNQSLARWQRA